MTQNAVNAEPRKPRFSVGDRVWLCKSPGILFPGAAVTVTSVETTDLGPLYQFNEQAGRWGEGCLCPIDEHLKPLARIALDVTQLRTLGNLIVGVSERLGYALRATCADGVVPPTASATYVLASKRLDDLREQHGDLDTFAEVLRRHVADVEAAFPCMTPTSVQTPAEILEEERSGPTRVRFQDATPTMAEVG